MLLAASCQAGSRLPVDNNETPTALRAGRRWPDQSGPTCATSPWARLGDGGQLLGGKRPVGLRGGDTTGQLLLQSGHAHHEDYVQVRGKECEKAIRS